MKNLMAHEAWRLLWVIATGIIAGLISSHFWAAIAIVLLAYCIWMLHHLFQLNRWIEKGLKRSEAPIASGVLENIISNIYRLKTSKKRSKKRLARLLRQFRASAEALPEATVILTTMGEIQWLNEAAENLLGLQTPRDIGQRIDNLIRNPEFREFLFAKDRKEELRLASPVDSAVKVSYRLINYGKERLLLTVRDVSVRERLDRMRSEFVSNASHELRTPLTVIRGYLEVMSEDKTCSNEVCEKMAIILEQASYMENIIDEMLTLSRLESSELGAAEGEIFSVSKILQKLVADAVQSGKAAAGQITINADDKLCMLGIRSEIISICSNLIYNALEHNPELTPVELQWFSSGSGAPCLVVSDDGQGIEQRHLSRLTERFYRVDSSRTRESGGSGLGLAIVKYIAQRHGGRIDISSTPAVGSTFTCCFSKTRAVKCDDEKKQQA